MLPSRRLPLQSIIRSYRQACALAVSKVKELSVSLEGKSDEEKRDLLVKCAATSLNSKLVRQQHVQHCCCSRANAVTAAGFSYPCGQQDSCCRDPSSSHTALTCDECLLLRAARCLVSASSLPRRWLTLSQHWTRQHWTSR